jgi:uncharacterized protein
VRFNKAIDQVQADRGRTAVTRGPLVYCAEGEDNGGSVQQYFLDSLPSASAIKTSAFSDGILAKIIKVELPSKKLTDQGAKASALVLIPYYAWDNRGDGSMMVWLSNSKGEALQPGESSEKKPANLS